MTFFLIDNYNEAIRNSWIHEELYKVRNVRSSFSKWGLYGGLLYSGLDLMFLKVCLNLDVYLLGSRSLDT